MDLIERATHSGCLCQLSDREQEILTQAYWFLVTPTDTYEELDFAPDPHPDLLQLETLVNKKMAPEDESDAAVEATIAGIDSYGRS